MTPKYKQPKRTSPTRPHKAAAAKTGKGKLGFGVDPNRAVLPIVGFRAGKRAH